MAYYYENPTSNYGTSLLYVNNLGSMFPLSSIIYKVYHYSHNTNYLMADPMDMRYDKTADKIALLHEIESPLWTSQTSTVFEFDGYNLSGLIARACIPTINSLVLFSVDNRLYNQYRALAGLDILNYPALSINQNGDDNCYIVKPIEYEDYSPFVRITSNYWEMNRLNEVFPRYITFYPNPETYLTDTLCE